jgi:site-specific recombinase XerD
MPLDESAIPATLGVEMKIKHRLHNGETRYIVDGKINGNRRREQFDTKREAELFLKYQTKEPTIAAWWAAVTLSERVDIMAAFNRAKEDGFSLLSAVETHAVQGRGNTHLKKCTLGEAVGSAYVDTRPKPDSLRSRHRGRPKNEVKPSGFLGAKFRKGVSKNTLFTLKSLTHNFRDYIGADVDVTHISPEMVESWLDAGGVKGHGGWENSTKEGYNRQIKNLFNWMIKRDHVNSNPAAKIEEIMLGEYEPHVLTVDEATQFLEITRRESPALLTPVALNLFCGIRPSEVGRLAQRDISFTDREVTLKGRQTKTRRKRFVDISDNCLEWLKLGAALPIANQNHQWAELMLKAKAELGYDKWPHDALRHSFCSYYLAAHENAAKTALQAGHTESILFKHYRKLVKKEQAEKFWNMFPEELAA